MSKISDPKDIATKALDNIRDLGEQPGMKQKIAEKLSQATGQNFTRQMVDRWLRPIDPVEPRLGIAILLFRIASDLDPVKCNPASQYFLGAPAPAALPKKKQKQKTKH